MNSEEVINRRESGTILHFEDAEALGEREDIDDRYLADEFEDEGSAGEENEREYDIDYDREEEDDTIAGIECRLSWRVDN